MKIKVRLYGTLGKHIPGYDPLEALALDMPDGSTTGDLLERLSVPKRKVGIVSVDGSLANTEHLLHDNCVVRIYRPLAGG